MEAGIEIESKIVSNLAEIHDLFMSGCWYLLQWYCTKNSILVWKVEYFDISLLPLYINYKSCLCTVYCTVFCMLKGMRSCVLKMKFGVILLVLRNLISGILIMQCDVRNTEHLM
jgi:hypothetical protein